MERQTEFERAAVAFARATVRYLARAEEIRRDCPGFLQADALAAARESTKYNASLQWVMDAHAGEVNRIDNLAVTRAGSPPALLLATRVLGTVGGDSSPLLSPHGGMSAPITAATIVTNGASARG